MAWFGRQAHLTSETERIIQRVESETADIYGPPAALSAAIVTGARKVWLELGPVLEYSTSGTPPEPSIYLFFELLYFYAHLTLRTALADRYSEQQIATLQSFMGPLLASTAVETFFSHWPDDYKSRLRSDFVAKLNEADQEYATCRTLHDQNDLFGTESLIGKIATNVCALWERDQDSAAITSAVSAVTSAMSTMHLQEHVEQVKVVIDRVDRTAVNSFWRSPGA